MSITRAIALAACVCAIPAVALAAKPPATTVTAGVTPSAITFGKSAVVSGTTTAGATVTLRADTFPYNNAFGQVARTTANAAGAYSFPVTPDSTTHYRVDVK